MSHSRIISKYSINGWDGEITSSDLRGYLSRGELYDDNWCMRLDQEDGRGWQLLKDVLNPKNQFGPGTRVQGLYGDEHWYDGTVVEYLRDGTHLVQFDGYEGSPPEVCSHVRAAIGSSSTAEPVPASAGAAVDTTATVSSEEEAVWHVLMADGVNTNGPFTVSQLKLQVAGGAIFEDGHMIHETGTEWVTIGSVTSKVSSEPVYAVAAMASNTPLADPTAVSSSSGGGKKESAKDFVARQTRRKQHVRQTSSVTVFSSKPTQSSPRSGTRSSPVKGGISTYRNRSKSNYDEAAAMQICSWMENIMDREIAHDAEEFKNVLMTETQIFCELFNTFKPNSTRKTRKSKMRFKQLENLNAFFMACKSILEMEDVQLFSGNELLDGKNFDRVLSCLADFARRMRAEFPPDDAPPELMVTFSKRR